MSYDEVKYWNDRMKNVGTVNSSVNEALHPTEERLIRKYVKQNDVVLDYGIGGGRTIPILQELNTDLLGYDIADMSSQILKKVAELPSEFKNFRYCYNPKIEKLPIKDNAFDVAISFYVLTHCKPENVKLVLRDITRVSKIAIISAYDDLELPLNDESYCYSHKYEGLFSDLHLYVLETEKPTKVRFWVLKKWEN